MLIKGEEAFVSSPFFVVRAVRCDKSRIEVVWLV
jgi:hypothetical protein